jgi:outer membrane lipoprotein carrier protein
MNHKLLVAAFAAFTMAACNTEPARTGGSPPADPSPPAAELPRDNGADAATETPGAGAPYGDAGPPGGAPPGRAELPPAGAVTPPSGAVTPPTAAPAAQAADEGAAALRQASDAYASVRSLRADFVMNFENPLLRQVTTSRGTIHQRQPDRIALRFSEPAGDLILSDGQFFWVYYPSVNAQQVIRSPAAAGGETGVNLQAQFVGNPVERFRYELHGTETVAGRAARVLTLVPRERAEYRSLKVWIDTRDGLVRHFELTEHNGNMRRFDLQNMQVNPVVPESVFQFTPPAGARIIDAG